LVKPHQIVHRLLSIQLIWLLPGTFVYEAINWLLSVEENNFLTALYSEDEVKKAVFQMEHNKAPGPDGFPAEFYQNFWEIISLTLFRLNFGEIILLPKIKEAERIQQYRPIYLLNVSFKIFTKVATIRLNTVADHVVRPSQTAFMQ
jgi:hypothetical protein